MIVKQRRISASRSVLLFGEGARDEAFLKHLKSCYYSRGCGFVIDIKSGNGGSPDDIVSACIAQIGIGSHELRTILMDTDIPWTKTAADRAKMHQIELLGSSVTLECWLIGLVTGKVWRYNTSRAKSYFSRHHLRSEDPTDPLSYGRCLPLELLEMRRKTDHVLARLINLMLHGE